jgi:hypothetical protein
MNIILIFILLILFPILFVPLGGMTWLIGSVILDPGFIIIMVISIIVLFIFKNQLNNKKDV